MINRLKSHFAYNLFSVIVGGCTIFIGGCGGGSASGSSPAAITPVVTLGQISDTTSAIYATSLQAFAETYIAGYKLLPSILDVVNAASYVGNGNGGGSTFAYGSGGPSGTTIFTNAKYLGGVTSVSPAISGASANTYTLTGTLSTSDTFFTNSVVKNVVLSSVSSFTGITPDLPIFSISSITNVVGTQTPNLPSPTVTLNSGAVSFQLGTSAYSLSSLNIKTSAPATTTFNLAAADGTNLQIFQLVKGVRTYNVSIIAGPFLIAGQDYIISSGTEQIASSSLTCSPMTVQFLSITQFSMACGGSSITKNWADADVLGALNSAMQ